MEEDVLELINECKAEDHPLILADRLSHFIIQSLREERITLYEAYLIHFEVLKAKRLAYLQPAWNERVQISLCLSFLNQKLLAHVFHEPANAQQLKEWAMEAARLNNEKRRHYIMDQFNLFLDCENDFQLLEDLHHIRESYDNLRDQEGPFHNEVFPFHFHSPEKILLLDRQGRRLYSENKDIRGEIETLLVEVSLWNT